MAIDFPNSPDPGTNHTVDGKTWTFTDGKWALNVGVGGVQGPTGATGPSGTPGATGASGAAGSWATTQSVTGPSGVSGSSTTGYTVVSGDVGKMIVCSSSGNSSITVNTTTGFSAGQSVDFISTGSGRFQFSAGAGVSVNSTPGLYLRTTYSSATLYCTAADTYVVFGDTSVS
jgi:hypothetical protein